MKIELNADDLAQIFFGLEMARDMLKDMPPSRANAIREDKLNELIDRLRVHERNVR